MAGFYIKTYISLSPPPPSFSFCQSICLVPSVFLFVCVSVFCSVCLIFCSSFCLSSCLSAWTSFCLSSLCLSVSRCLFLSVCLSQFFSQSGVAYCAPFLSFLLPLVSFAILLSFPTSNAHETFPPFLFLVSCLRLTCFLKQSHVSLETTKRAT